MGVFKLLSLEARVFFFFFCFVLFLSTITFIKKTIVKISLPVVLVKLGKLYIYILIKLKGDVAEIVEHVVQVIQEMGIDTTDSATKKKERIDTTLFTNTYKK